MVVHRRSVLSAISIFILVTSSNLLAHTSIVKKNTPEKWNVTEEMEGNSGSISAIVISHGCSSPGLQDTQSVQATAVVWPNGINAQAVRSDTGETINLHDEILGNAVMSPSPIQDRSIFDRINIRKAHSPGRTNPNEQAMDTRAFHYTNGRLERDLVGLLPYRASYPKFKTNSCVTKMQINIAIANYCSRVKSSERNNRADIWIAHLTEKFDDSDVVSIGYWPNVTVLRNLKNNPLDPACGEGYTIKVSPSADSIDKHLPIRHYWPAKRKQTSKTYQ